MKKIITMLLAGIMALCLIPAGANAANPGETTTYQDNGFTLSFRSQGNGWLLTGVTGSGETLTIPATVNGDPVLDISLISIDNLPGLRTLVISEGIKTVGYRAFYSLSDLRTLYLPSSLEAFGWDNYDLPSLRDVYFAGSPGRLQVLVEGKNYIERQVGNPAPDLTYWNNATFHYGQTNDDAYYTITQRGNAIYPDKGTVTVNPTTARAGETVSLTVKPVPGNAVSTIFLRNRAIGSISYTWSLDSNTASFVMPSGNVTYDVIYASEARPDTKGDAFYRIPGGVLSFDRKTGTITSFQMEGDGTVTLPRAIDGVRVKKIGPKAFMDCSGLKKVIIPGSIETIGDSAFYRCKDLEEVQIEDGKLIIEQWAFSNCINLKSIRLPVGLDSLTSAPFVNCFSLKALVIPDGTRAAAFVLPENTEVLYLPASVVACGISNQERLTDLYFAGNKQRLDAMGAGNPEVLFPTYWERETRIHYNYSVPAQPEPVVSDVTAIPVTETSAPQPTAPQSFTDVPGSAWYASSVADVQQYGIIQGVGNGKFSPNSTLSLAQAITMAARTYAYTNGLTITDNGAGDWYEPYLRFAAEHGICARGEFGMDYNAPCSRLVMAQLFCRAFPQNTANQLNDVTVLPDVANTPANQSVFFLYQQGVLVGNDSQGTFTPNASITRAQTATILVRVLDSSKRQHIELPGME